MKEMTDNLKVGLDAERLELLDYLLAEEGIETGSESQKIVRRPPHDDALPLSFAQQRLWFLDQLAPGAAYNLPGRLHLEGRLDISALEKSLNEIVRRHEALRTIFTTRNGEPVQIILHELHLPLPLIDLSDLPSVQKFCDEEAQRPFDLTTGPLVRAHLLRLSREEHILLLSMHHIVSDGWSIGVLIRELAALYEANAAGVESPLKELSLQYGDYAVWQREWLQGEVLDQQVSYWRQQLEGAPALLKLPTDRPRPATQTYRGTTESFVLSAALTANLKEFSRQHNVTLFMVLLAAFQLLLHRYTGQKDIVVGSPIA